MKQIGLCYTHSTTYQSKSNFTMVVFNIKH